MNFVFLNQYYPPDVAPTGVMLEGVVQRLVRDGHDVTVLCASGGYGKKVAGVPDATIRDERPGADARTSGPDPQQAPAGTSGNAEGVTPGRVAVVRIGATKFGRGTVVGKLLDYASFYVGVIWRLLVMRPRPERMVALTTPPYLSVVARLVSKLRGADHAHWVMDLYPDVMVAHGMLKEGGVLHRVAAGLARWGFGGPRCAAVLTLGPDMAARVGSYLSESSPLKVDWVALWSGEREIAESKTADGGRENEAVARGADLAPEETTRQREAPISSLALRKARGWADNELVVMYSGNMGLGHRFGEMLEAALALKDQWVRFVFFGDGRRRGEIADFMLSHPECRMELHPYAPAEELTEHLRSAEVHLASLDPAWTGTMVPSKLQGIFAAGRPVIFIGSEASSIGQWILASGAGWLVSPDDGSGLLAALAEARQPEVLVSRGRAARAFAVQHFNEAVNIPRVAAVLGRHGRMER